MITGNFEKDIEDKLTLRDQFAMAALNGLLATTSESGQSLEDYTKWAYKYADAMMEARDD